MDPTRPFDIPSRYCSYIIRVTDRVTLVTRLPRDRIVNINQGSNIESKTIEQKISVPSLNETDFLAGIFFFLVQLPSSPVLPCAAGCVFLRQEISNLYIIILFFLIECKNVLELSKISNNIHLCIFLAKSYTSRHISSQVV